MFFGGFKWSSQHMDGGDCDEYSEAALGSVGRGALRSPGRPGVARREERRRLWASIAAGLSSEDAAAGAGVSPAVGARWFREAGGMPPAALAPSSKPPSGRYLSWLLSDSGVAIDTSRNQPSDEGAEQGFAAPARIVYKLEEAEVERQFVLRDAPMRSQPGAQQRPKSFHRVDVDLTEAVPVLVAGILAAPMADRLVPVAPGWQARVDAILVGVDEGARGDGGGDDRLDRRLLHVGQHAQHDLSAALDQAEDGRLVLRKPAPSRRAGQLAAPSKPPLLATSSGWPLCPATT